MSSLMESGARQLLVILIASLVALLLAVAAASFLIG